MKQTLLISFLWLFALQLHAQFGEVSSKGAKSLGMGGADVAFDQVQALYSNIAGLTSIEGLQIQVAGQQYFGLPEFSDFSLAVALTVQKLGGFGLTLSSYGVKSFSEQSIGIAYARSLSSSLDIGAKFNLFNFRIDQYGGRLAPSVELGFRSTILEPFIFAFHVASPISVKLGPNSDIPTKLSLGIAYNPSDKLSTVLEASTYIDGQPNIALGIDYKIIDLLSLRLGAGTNPGLISGGFAIHLKDKYTIEASFSRHQVLGLTPGVSIIYTQTRSKKR